MNVKELRAKTAQITANEEHNPTFANQLRILSGPCGAGKTHGFIEYAERIGHGVIIVQPSLVLNQESYKKVSDPNKWVVINSDTVSGSSVNADLIDYLKNDYKEKNAFITHKAFLNLSSDFCPNVDKITVLIDEVLPAYQSYGYELEENYHLLTDYLTVQESLESDQYYNVFISDLGKKKIDNYAASQHDDVNKLFKDLSRDLKNNDCIVWVKKAQWDKFVVGKPDDEKRHLIEFFTFLSPSFFGKFREVIFAAAHIDCQLWHQIYSKRANMADEHRIKLRYDEYPRDMVDRLTIHYFPQKTHSKNLRNKVLPSQTTIGEIMGRKVFDIANGREILFSKNKDDQNEYDPSFTEVPVISHGLNDYDNISVAYVGYSLNPRPSHVHFLSSIFGITKDDIACDRAVYEIQTFLRTAARNPDRQDDIDLITNCQRTSELIEVLLGGDVQKAPIEMDDEYMKVIRKGYGAVGHRSINRQDKIESAINTAIYDWCAKNSYFLPVNAYKVKSTKKSRTSSYVIRKDLLDCLIGVKSVSQKKKESYTKKKEMAQSDREFELVFTPSTDWGNAQRNVDISDIRRGTWDELADAFFSEKAFVISDDKTGPECSFFNPWSFADSNGGRNGENATHLNMVVLDYDKEVKMDEVIAQLDSMGLAYALYTSYNHSNAEKNFADRFRVVIPLDKPMPKEEVEARRNNMAKVFCGVDPSTFSISRGFWLPACSEENRHKAFAMKRDGKFLKWTQFKKKGIRKPVISTVIVPDEITPDMDNLTKARVTVKNEAKIRAINEWRYNTPVEEGNPKFFRLAFALHRNHFSLPEIEFILHNEANYGRHPDQRRAQIKSIINTLERGSNL